MEVLGIVVVRVHLGGDGHIRVLAWQYNLGVYLSLRFLVFVLLGL